MDLKKKYSASELAEMGFGEAQINAILDADRKKEEVVVDVEAVNASVQVRSGDGNAIPLNSNEAMSPTSIFELQSYSQGTLVRFPDFAEGQPFVARVRRPSMLVLAKQGKIPNTLLTSANELFSKGGSGLNVDDTNMLSDMYDIMEVVCEAALKEPTYKQIKDAGLGLSDDQLMAIFNYTQSGVRALESFR